MDAYEKIKPYEKCQRELQDLLQAQYPLIFLRSSEESRAIKCAISAHENLVNYTSEFSEGELVRWNSLEGFQKRSSVTDDPSKATWKRLGNAPNLKEDPILQALNILQERLETQATPKPQTQNTYILPDWSEFIQGDCHLTARQLKDLVLLIEQRRPRPRMSLIVIGSDWSIPIILRNHVHILDLPLPIGEELYEDVFSYAIDRYDISEEEARRLSEEAQGMPLQAANQTAKLITTKNIWSQPDQAGQLLLEVKKQEIRKTGVLEYYEPTDKGLDDVGGLEEIKTWIRDRRDWFEQDEREELRPRAILLEGFPGCGKSFIARAIAQEWRVPQINFEISRLQSKWVGESESNTYQALRAIEASAPNILFMDEIEKAFSGVGGDSSGVTTRQFGTFLSWLNDHKYPIFFIATSNNRNLLPPELFRAGRFDEIFIVMPPNHKERREILEKKVQNYKLPAIPSRTVEFLVDKTMGFSGAELEKLVRETIYLAGYGYLPTDGNWEQALAKINPQYRTPMMQSLLQHYYQILKEGGGKSASKLEEGFIENLILPTKIS
jgi:AAA+ superfamily predicted ATPase